MKYQNTFINICIIKQITTSYPSVFEDSAHCLSHLLGKIGIRNTISYNTIDPTIANIVLGVGAGNTVPIEEFQNIAKPDKTIIFNMEQTGSKSSFINSKYLQLLSKYVSLDYNQANIQATEKKINESIQGFEFPLAPFFEIKTNPYSTTKIKYDYGFYGAMNEARSQKIDELEKMGLKIKKISAAYGEFLTDAMMDCKAILNIHYYDTKIFEAARALRPTSIGIPIISEPSILPKTINWKKSGVFFTENDFCQDAYQIIKNHDELTELSRKSISFTKEASWIPIADQVIERALYEMKNR